MQAAIQTNNKPSAVHEMANYQVHLDQLLELLDSFQTQKNASLVFQWLDYINNYGFDLSEGEAILEMDYPSIWKFYEVLKNLDFTLETKYKRIGTKEARETGVEIFALLGRIARTLEEEKIKKRIVFEHADFEPYEIGELPEWPGMKMKILRQGIWPDFNPLVHLNNYLFDDYMQWLNKRFSSIVAVVEKFEAGDYPDTAKVMSEKPRNQYPDLINGIINERRRNEFKRLCFRLARKCIFKTGVDAQFIKYNEQTDSFDWIGAPEITSKHGPIPSLAEFIRMLEREGFFGFPSQKGRYDLCKSFLWFFNLPVTENNWKYLSKELKNKESKYAGLFDVGTWYAA